MLVERWRKLPWYGVGVYNGGDRRGMRVIASGCVRFGTVKSSNLITSSKVAMVADVVFRRDPGEVDLDTTRAPFFELRIRVTCRRVESAPGLGVQSKK